ARVLHMGDQRDARRPEARVFLRALHLLAELLREFAVHGRDVDAHLLEDAAMHDRHLAAAFVMCPIAALPWRALEAPGRAVRQRAGQFVFKAFELGADQVAQFAEPGLRPFLPLGSGLVVGHAFLLLDVVWLPLLT